ncbi:MAG: hypothetical protein QG628_222, partial [Patescibacteria group bacterium]|nr:hypothetical protein [Patescibacteria group bacterium]
VRIVLSGKVEQTLEYLAAVTNEKQVFPSEQQAESQETL